MDEVSLPVVPRLLNLWGTTLKRCGVRPKALDKEE